MNNHYTYFLILAGSVAGPLALSFDKKVAFYKQWRYVFTAMLIPALFYIAWDIYFTSQSVWHFNEQYITGSWIINLPVEEVLFFFIVPYCCVFIYECIRCYFPLLKGNRKADDLMKVLAFALLVTGIIFYDRSYTSWTSFLNAAFIALIYLCKNYFRSFNAIAFLVSYGVSLIPFLIVNGLLTAIPVVLYNDVENIGKRIYTIPVEDIFYGMLLVMMNIALFEKLREKRYQ